MENKGDILEELSKTRDQLFEALPTGKIDAFDLIKKVKIHIESLDTILDYYSRIKNDEAELIKRIRSRKPAKKLTKKQLSANNK
jgi:hypothetical protein